MMLARNGRYARCLPCMQLVRSMCQCKSIMAIHRSCLIVLSSCPDTAPSTLAEARILAHTAGSSVGFGSIQQHVYGHHVVTQHPIHLYPIIHNHPALEFAILSTRISVAPQAVSSSITLAIFSFNTIELIAAHLGSSSAVIVGARLPGVIFVAVSRRLRSTLYWQRTYFWAADERY